MNTSKKKDDKIS